MQVQICLPPLLLFIQGISAMDYSLGWVITDKEVSLPLNIDTNFYSVNLPPLERVFKIADKNLNSLLETIDNGEIFKSDPQIVDKVYPMNELGIRLKLISNKIMVSIANLRKYLEDTHLGTVFRRQQAITITLDELLPESEFIEASTYIIDLKANKDTMPSSGQEKQFRESLIFHKIESSAAILVSLLDNYNKKLVSYLNTIKYFSGELAPKQLFIQNLLEKKLDSEFKILRVPYFESSPTKVTVILEVALKSNFAKFHRYVGIQYFNQKISHEFFSSKNNSLMEMECLGDHICYPVLTSCTKSIKNNSMEDILKNCDFKKSTKEYDILVSQGIMLNYEPESKDMKDFLKEFDFQPLQYPVLLRFNGCAKLNSNESNVCFSTPNTMIYSKLDTKKLDNLMNPPWYIQLYNNVLSVTRILTYLIFSVTSAIILMISRMTYEFYKYLYARMYYCTRMRREQRQRLRRRARSSERSRSCSKDRSREKRATSRESRERRSKRSNSETCIKTVKIVPDNEI